MKTRWYSNRLVKGILIAIEHIALILALICGVFLIDQYNQGNSFKDMRISRFVSTSGFGEQVFDNFMNIMEGESARDQLRETNEDGSQRVIDLREANDGEISYKNTSGLAYTVADLKDWAKSSSSEEDFYDGKDCIVVCRTLNNNYKYLYYSEFIRQYNDGELQIEWADDTSEEGKRDVLKMLQSGEYYDTPGEIRTIQDKDGAALYLGIWNFTTFRLNERYKPVGASSILEVLNENENWNGRLDEALTTLYNEVGDMRNVLNTQSALEYYAEGNTNITYLIANRDTKTIYTNKKAYEDYDDLKASLANISQEGSYTVIRPKLSNCETNMNIDLHRWQETFQSWHSNQDNYVFAVNVDQTFPVSDSLAVQNDNYNKYNQWLTPALMGLITGSIVFLLGLIWLTIIAGRNSSDGEVHLCGFDRWFTEIAAVVIFAVWVSIISIPFSVGSEWIGSTSVVDSNGNVISMTVNSVFDNTALAIVILAAMGAFTAAMFLTGWLSLVRRIKAKTLWKNSLIRWILSKIRGLWRRLKNFVEENVKGVPSVPRLITMVVIFFLIQLILGLMASQSGLAFLIFLGLDGAALVHLIRKAAGRQHIIDGLKRITGGELDYKIPTEKLEGEQKDIAEAINNIGAGLDAAVENSLKSERMKTELITNVSHDIKTPLTSIINYIDLLKRENFTDPKILGYLDVLEKKAQRLKSLTEDVVEASRVSTGNITIEMANLNYVEMLHQVCGEFQERFEEKSLTMVVNLPGEPVVIRADGRRLYRVLENIFGNAAKYAMEGTRVYVDLRAEEGKAVLQLKNISAQPLNISADDLTERFIRGDVARSTEGSGLGLSIAKSLTALQNGDFQLYLDGDLFKVVICFPLI